jgi:hypothetical protein
MDDSPIPLEIQLRDEIDFWAKADHTIVTDTKISMDILSLLIELRDNDAIKDKCITDLQDCLESCATCLDMQEGYEPYDTAIKLLAQQPAKKEETSGQKLANLPDLDDNLSKLTPPLANRGH